MKPRGIFWHIILILLFWNCSKDDEMTSADDFASQIPDIQIIGEDAGSIYWYDFDAESSTGTTVNLTEEDNVDRLYIALRQVSDVLSFFSLSDGNYSLVQKHLDTGESSEIVNFLSISGERSIIWGTTTESQILMGYYSPPGSRQLGVRSIDPSTGTFTDSPLATGVFTNAAPMYFEKRLFAAYLDVSNSYHMVVFDTENLSVMRVFDFEEEFPSLLIDGDRNFVILRGNSGVFSRETYDVNTMELLEQTSFNLQQFLSTGPINAYLIDDVLYYQYSLVQPAPVVSTPATYNFDTRESTITDIISIIQQVEAEIGGEITLTAFGLDVRSKTFLMGYALNSNPVSFEGGVIFISEKGDLIDVQELPFVPTYFIRS